MSSSTFVLPVRYLHNNKSRGSGSDGSSAFGCGAGSGGGGDPSRFSILGEQLPETHHEAGPPLGISVAAVIASATTKANEGHALGVPHNVDDHMHGPNTSNKKPFQLPIRKVVDQYLTKTDDTAKWESTL